MSALRVRHMDNNIYTLIGIVLLIAMGDMIGNDAHRDSTEHHVLVAAGAAAGLAAVFNAPLPGLLLLQRRCTICLTIIFNALWPLFLPAASLPL